MRFFLILSLSMCSTLLSAHGSYGSGIMAGLSHPFFGLDHLLAIFTMALYAKVSFKESAWLIIFSFVIAMVIGGVIGIDASPFPLLEWVITLSVIFYGLLLGLDVYVNSRVFLGIGFVIGLCHGYAHGVEMPDSTTTIQYIPGYALGSIIIAAFGEFVGRHLATDNIRIARFFGGIAVGVGLMIIL